MIETAVRRSGELFESGWYCAESVLIAVTEELDVRCEPIPRIATGFCSGLARTGGLCGALSGAILTIGIAAGRDAAEDPIDPAYVLVRAILRRFEERFDATTCLELIGCDLATDEGRQRYTEAGRHERCAEYVRGATRMVLEALDEEDGRR